jgi:hypothetical protein
MLKILYIIGFDFGIYIAFLRGVLKDTYSTFEGECVEQRRSEMEVMMKNVKWILVIGLLLGSSVSFAQSSTLRLEKRGNPREYQTKNRNQEPIIDIKNNCETFDGLMTSKKEVTLSLWNVGEGEKNYTIILTKSNSDISDYTYQLREVSSGTLQITRQDFAEENSHVLGVLEDSLRIQIELLDDEEPVQNKKYENIYEGDNNSYNE